MFDVDLLINNADVKAAGGATFDRLNPLTGEVASRAAAASAEDAVRAADAAAAAFPAWAEVAPAARRALLNKAADLLAGQGQRVRADDGAPRPAPPPCGPASTACWPPTCCARPRP